MSVRPDRSDPRTVARHPTDRLARQLPVQVHPDRLQLGRAAAADIADALRTTLENQPRARIMFASAPSQDPMISALRSAHGIDWSRVEAFHMDEYIGLDDDAPQRFGRFIVDRLFDAVRPGRVHLLEPGEDLDAECCRYSALLAGQPLDIVCLGIGENAHLAFNDPMVADFHDPRMVKIVELDEVCRRQQVNDGCFEALRSVPRQALTVTIPVLMSARQLFAVVPGRAKAIAVRDALTGRVHESCPASILTTHPACTLYLDTESAALIDANSTGSA